jgi:hypothetical protein
MTAYQNCKVGDARQVKMDSGEVGVGDASASSARTVGPLSRCRLRHGKTLSWHRPRWRRRSQRPLRSCRKLRPLTHFCLG